MNSFVLSIYDLLIYLTNNISHLIKLSFNTQKSTRGLDALSHIIHFLHLLSTNHKCTQPCYFSPATQTRGSEGEDGLEFFNEEF
jgi:hypothetical protein